MPTVAVAETPHYYVEEPSFIGGVLCKRGAKIKTHALPSVNWRPLNAPAHAALEAVRTERFDYEITLQDGTVKQMSVQPRLMAKTLGGGRGSLSGGMANAPLEEHDSPEPYDAGGVSLGEVTLGGKRSQDQRPGPAVAQGPAAFEPTPEGEPEPGPDGSDVLITQPAPLGAGVDKDGKELKTSKGSPIAPMKNGVVE